MVRSYNYLIVVPIVLFILLVVSIVAFNYNAYLLLSFLIIGAIMFPFFARLKCVKLLFVKLLF